MPPQTAADPLRVEVEAALRRAVTDVVELPCRFTRSARERLEPSVAIAQSVIGLMWANIRRAAEPAGGSPPRSAPAPAARQPEPAPAIDSPPSPGSDRRSVADAGPSAADLPIPDYESLAASQVVARLERLDPAELRQVEEFERANRGRRTVLGKIAQLRGRA